MRMGYVILCLCVGCVCVCVCVCVCCLFFRQWVLYFSSTKDVWCNDCHFIKKEENDSFQFYASEGMRFSWQNTISLGCTSIYLYLKRLYLGFWIKPKLHLQSDIFHRKPLHNQKQVQRQAQEVMRHRLPQPPCPLKARQSRQRKRERKRFCLQERCFVQLIKHLSKHLPGGGGGGDGCVVWLSWRLSDAEHPCCLLLCFGWQHKMVCAIWTRDAFTLWQSICLLVCGCSGEGVLCCSVLVIEPQSFCLHASGGCGDCGIAMVIMSLPWWLCHVLSASITPPFFVLCIVIRWINLFFF